jgi:hypothetical protein
MNQDEIKNECYNLLWELFSKECPYFNRWDDKNRSERIKRGLYSIYCSAGGIDGLTILMEILPDHIMYDNFYNRKEIIFSIDHDGKQVIRFQYQKKQIILSNGYENDFWLSLLSLLKSIQSNPNRQNFQFKWGKK